MKPKFVHDCDACKFLGHFYDHDVYICQNSLIARYSDEGHEYHSWPKGVFVDTMANPEWAESKSAQAIAAALSCQALGETPRQMQRFANIGDVRAAVDRLKWDMLSGPDKRDIVPDPSWGLEANVAFNHFYIARSLLEQAEHHLSIADAHYRMCLEKFHEQLGKVS